MPSKQQISDTLNALLKTKIDFTKLSTIDLEALTSIFEDSTFLVQLGIMQFKNKAKKEVLERPLKDFLDRNFLEERMEKGGLLGLGILPRVLEKAQQSRK